MRCTGTVLAIAGSIFASGVVACGVVFGLGACGGGGAGPDARIDAVVYPDGELPGTCDYTEQDDAGNATGVEATGLTVGGAAQTICGQIDPGHFAKGVVDDDTYGVTVGVGGADLIVRLAAQPSTLAPLFVQLEDAQGVRSGYAVFVVDHGVTVTHLAAGAYTVVVEGNAAADVAAAIPYRVVLSGGAPSALCPRVTDVANHVETDESASKDTADDVVYISAAAGELLTPNPDDAPDNSGIVVSAGKAYRITGTSADVDVAPPNGDDYHDRDTFLISTGADTDELDVRLDWTGATNNLDVYLFPEVETGGAPRDIGSAATDAAEEVQAIAVAPSSRYWLWIGGADTSKALPSTYDVSICGVHAAQ